MDYQQLLIQHLAVIDKVVRFVARRHHLSTIDTEEFASLVRFKLVDRNFAILRKFEQRSSITTYLTVVIERLCLDFCVAKWGKWRPSAAARRLGAVAIRLEQLLVREGITFDEAVGTLQTNHAVSESRAELHSLLLQLPLRGARRGDPSVIPGDIVTTHAESDRDDAHLAARLHAALSTALATLDAHDQRLVSLRFGHGLAVAQIARMLDLEPKPLYRRLEHIIRMLRAELTRQGIAEGDIARIVGHPTFALSGVILDGPH